MKRKLSNSTKTERDEKRAKKIEASIKKIEEANETLLLANRGIKRAIIYADPPWEYTAKTKTKKGGYCGNASDHYDTLSVEEMKGLKVSEIAAEDSLIAMWTTGPHLLNAGELMEAWGFKYKTMFHVWVKTTNGEIKGPKLGFYTRQFAEFLLLGTRGNILKYKNEKCPFIPNAFLEDTKEHSRKPYKPIDTINRIFKNVPKLELFARSTTDIKWDVWGNETSKYSSQEFDDSDILDERFKQIKIMNECSKLKFKGTKRIESFFEEEEEEEVAEE